MALETNRYYLTDRGNELLHESLGGTVLQLSSVKLGAGQLPEEETALRGMAGLAAAVQDFKINTMVTGKGKAKISIAVRNTGLTSGYYATEGGVFCMDPDTGEETLFAVAKLDGTYIPAFSKNTIVNQLYSIHLVIGEAEVNIAGDDLYQLKSEALTIEKVYPVGSLYLAIEAVDPNVMWPSTKWERLQEGVVLLAAGDTYQAGKEYGSNSVKIKKENLPNEKIPLEIESGGEHAHKSIDGFSEAGFDVTNGGGDSNGGSELRIAYGDNWPYHGYRKAAETGLGGKHTHEGTTKELGEGKPLSILPHSMAVYFWRRIE